MYAPQIADPVKVDYWDECSKLRTNVNPPRFNLLPREFWNWLVVLNVNTYVRSYPSCFLLPPCFSWDSFVILCIWLSGKNFVFIDDNDRSLSTNTVENYARDQNLWNGSSVCSHELEYAWDVAFFCMIRYTMRTEYPSAKAPWWPVKGRVVQFCWHETWSTRYLW